MVIKEQLNQKKETSPFTYFHDHFYFLTRLMECLRTQETLNDQTRMHIERNVTTSLSLLWSLHVSYFSKKRLYLQLNYDPLSKQDTDSISLSMGGSLQKFKAFLDGYSFYSEHQEKHCKNMTNQLLQFYSSHPDYVRVVIKSNSLKPPWLSGKV